MVTTFAWLTSEAVGYVANSTRRVLYQHGIARAPAERTLVYDDDFPSTITCETQKEWWSPDGRFVMLRKSGGGYELVGLSPEFSPRKLGGGNPEAELNRSSQLANWATCVLSCFCRPGHFQSSFPIVGSYLVPQR